MANTSSLRFVWEAYAVFCLFILDQSKDKYWILQASYSFFKPNVITVTFRLLESSSDRLIPLIGDDVWPKISEYPT